MLFLSGLGPFDLAGQRNVSRQQFAELDESADDENFHLHRSLAIEHGEHGGSCANLKLSREVRENCRSGIGNIATDT
jgi:hypothetical protein